MGSPQCHVASHSARRWAKQGIKRVLVVGVLVMVWCFPVLAVPTAPPDHVAAWGVFLKGLEALHDAQWAEAVRQFSAAQAQGLNNPHLFLARAVANALRGKFELARTDLGHGPGREAELWTYVVERMSGQVSAAHGIPIIRSMQQQYGKIGGGASIPGHMIQGGRDYSTDYASFIYYEMAAPYGKARQAGTLSSAPGLHDALVKAGRWVANRIAAHSEFALLHYQRAHQLMQRNQTRNALTELTFAASAFPEDADVLFLTAECWRHLGRPVTARRLYTEVLTRRSDFADAYLGRAWTAAQLGDRQRVAADLAVAGRLDKHQTGTVRAKIEALAQKQAVTGDPRALFQNLQSAALKGASIEALLPQATRLQKVMAAQSKRYDEWYQDQIRRKEDAVRAHPDDPAPRVALARFLVDESGNRFETVEPARGRVPLRWQPSAAEELNQAVSTCDEALHRHPKNVPALVTRAMALLALDRGPEAKQLVDQALHLSGFGDPQALVLYAQFKFKQAGAVEMQAFALRMPTYTSSTHDEWRSDGLWRVTTTTRYDPSPSDLARANNLEAQATAMLREADASMQKAVQATRGTLEGLLIESQYEFWYKSRDRAGALLREAVTKYPDSLQARDKLAWYYRWMLQYDNSVEAQQIALNQVQTSVGPLLGRVWHNIEQGGWQACQKDLDRALQRDPTDARGAYYQAAAYEAQGRSERARAFFRVATALEEARLRLDEPPFVVGAPLPRPASDLALLMGARLHLAQAVATQHPQEALGLFQANAALGTRLAPGGLAQPMFGAMLPDPKAPKMPRPTPENAANLLAASHLQIGKILAGLGRSDEAMQAYAAAASFGRQPGSMIPNVGTGRPGDSNFDQYADTPAAVAQVELARGLIGKQQWKQAMALLNAAAENHLPAQMRQEINTLSLQAAQAINNRQSEKASRAYAQQQQAMQAQLQANRRQAQQREALQRSGAPVDPRLVGQWKTLADANPMATHGPIQFSVQSDGTYTWTEAGKTTQGQIRGWNTRVTLTPNGGQPQTGAYRYLAGGSFGSVAGSGQEELQLAFFTGQQYRFIKTTIKQKGR